MKKLLLALAVLAPGAAFAAGTPGLYVQGVVGGNAVFLNDDYSFDNDKTATGYSFGGAIGYLWGCSNFNYGVEFGALDYPNSTTGTISIPGNGTFKTKVAGYNFDLLGVAKYNFDSGLNVFGKAGVAYVNQKDTFSGSLIGQSVTSGTDNKYAPEVALGVGYQFNQNWEANITANTVFAGKAGDSNKVVARNGNVLLGVTYRFV